MATVGLYGSSSSGVVASASGSESTGLYGNNVSFGGSYFEWFIFTQADTQPATPTGGSWDFTTNTGTPPTGWSAVPPSAPTNKVWVSIALVSSKNTSSLVWSAPGLFSYSSGLPILSGNGIPASGAGVSDQLYIQLDTAPQTIWFKESGTWTRLTGSSLYVDLTSNQTIAGTKTFSSTIQGSVSGTSSNVTGTVGITNGGTGSTTASGARTALGAAASGANSDITSLSGLTTPLSVAQGGTGATTASGALSNIGGIGSITSTDGSIIVSQVGTAVNVAVSEASPASTVLTPVRNTTGATLTKGTVVYISGATGQIATVSKALATSDATSAQTLGMITSDLANNSNGYVTVFGLLIDVDTSAYADGTQLYLSGTTAGAVTATKPSAPIHLVYVGVVEYSHAIHGKILVKVQNGYELDELHDVSITSVAAYNMLQRNSANTLWTNIAGPTSVVVGISDTQTLTNKTISGASNTLSSIGNSSLINSSITINGSSVSLGGSTTVTATATNALTIGTGLSGTSYNGSTAVTIANTGVLSISGGTTGLTPSSATAGAVTLGGTLAVANGGTGVTTSTGTGSVVLSTSPALVTPALGTPTSGNFSTGTFTWPTFNQNTTGNAATATTATNVSGGTASVTTLTTSSTVTLNGGTANAVPYLNASKVLTSGSALTFDGTNFATTGSMTAGNTGVVLTGRYSFVFPTSGAGYFQLNINNSDGINGGIDVLTLSAGVLRQSYRISDNSSGSGYQSWNVAGSEQMRLTSTGLGIGTSSPDRKLSIYTTDATGKMALFSNGNTNTNLYLSSDPSSGGAVINVSNNAGSAALPLLFQMNGSEKMRLDTSGNLGFGVTPSAWSLGKAFELSSGALFGYSTSELHVTQNTYYNAGWKYTNSSVGAGRYFINSGAHSWFTAPSGTAGAAITFTQAMTLDASGNLLVGTTSTGYSNANTANPEGAFGRFIANHPSGTASGTLYVGFGYNGAGIGSITQNGTTGVLYNLTSDYRLKNNPVPVTGAKEFINALQPKTWDWWDGSGKGVGFIAHEFMEVAKYSGNGTKDAVDDDGNPVYQSIQPSSSEVMANLVAYVQELRAEFDAYKAAHP